MMLGLSGVSAFLLGLGTLYFFLYRLQLRRGRPDEPPVIAAPGLPFLGHVLGMGIQGGRYLQRLGLRLHTKSPGTGIFTLPVPMSRIYLVTDPTLAVAVQRATRAMSFTPIAPEATRRILGFDDAAMRIVRPENVTVAATPTKSATTGAMSIIDEQKYDESHGFMADMHDLIYKYMLPGDTLNTFVLDASRELVGQVNAYASSMASEAVGSGSSPPIVDLLAWTKSLVTAGTAQFLYGPRHLMAEDPELEQAFWDFVHGLGRLLVVGGKAPGSRMASVLGGRPFAAREQLVAGFVKYLESGQKGNDFIQRRLAVGDRYGWDVDGLARSELSFLFASIINTSVTSFWVVLRLFADPALLQAVREELGDSSSDKLSMEHIRSSCPMLQAVYQESLRLGSNNTSTRLVLTDTKLADRYFLRAGSVVQVAAGVMHADPALWGENADVFDPAHFLKSSTTSSSYAASTKRHPAAFRAFGGGKTLCPGRHFATGEILAYVAAVVQTFDVEDAKEGLPPGTPPQVPARNDRMLPVHILEPTAKDVPQVRLRLRQPGRTLQAVA